VFEWCHINILALPSEPWTARSHTHSIFTCIGSFSLLGEVVLFSAEMRLCVSKKQPCLPAILPSLMAELFAINQHFIMAALSKWRAQNRYCRCKVNCHFTEILMREKCMSDIRFFHYNYLTLCMCMIYFVIYNFPEVCPEPASTKAGILDSSVHLGTKWYGTPLLLHWTWCRFCCEQ